MPCDHVLRIIEVAAIVFGAFSTFAVAVLAIWGDWIRNRLLGPRLELSPLNPLGDLTFYGSGQRAYFYHLRVKNQPRRNAARGARILVRAVSRRAPGGTFIEEPMVYPLQLQWTPMEHGEVERTVVDESTCDFGVLRQHEGRFQLAVMLTPNNFRGHVASGDCLRFEILANGHNVLTLRPIVLEVSWDGTWNENQQDTSIYRILKADSSGDVVGSRGII